MENKLFELARRRRSCRRYTGEKIPDEIVDEILKVALLAPSSWGGHPIEFVVVRDKNMIKKIARCKRMGAGPLSQADVAIVVMANRSNLVLWVEDAAVASTYILRAENSAALSPINGRLMHAAFFQILNEYSTALGSFVHNKQNMKTFTVSFLEPEQDVGTVGERWAIRRGEKFFWRVTGLNKEILQAALSVSVGKKIQAGGLTLRVDKIICDGDIRSDSGVVSVENFISAIKHAPSAKEIRFDFVSPVSFRIDEFDAPYPRPELIFASLADKWTQSEMPAAVDKKIIRELAAQIRLTQWSGESQKFYFGRDRGTLAFFGRFLYNVEATEKDTTKVFMLLAKFGEFAGVGRLTGQGFGQPRVSWFN